MLAIFIMNCMTFTKVNTAKNLSAKDKKSLIIKKGLVMIVCTRMKKKKKKKNKN